DFLAIHADRGFVRVRTGDDDRLNARGRHGLPIGNVHAVVQHPPRHRAVLSAGVEVAEAESARHTLGHARLTRAGRPIHRDHDALVSHLGTTLFSSNPTPGLFPRVKGIGAVGASGQLRTVQPRSVSRAVSGSADSGATWSVTRPTGCPGECSIRTSSMLTPAAPAAAKSRASSPGASLMTTGTAA